MSAGYDPVQSDNSMRPASAAGIRLIPGGYIRTASADRQGLSGRPAGRLRLSSPDTSIRASGRVKMTYMRSADQRNCTPSHALPAWPASRTRSVPPHDDYPRAPAQRWTSG